MPVTRGPMTCGRCSSSEPRTDARRITRPRPKRSISVPSSTRKASRRQRQGQGAYGILARRDTGEVHPAVHSTPCLLPQGGGRGGEGGSEEEVDVLHGSPQRLGGQLCQASHYIRSARRYDWCGRGWVGWVMKARAGQEGLPGFCDWFHFSDIFGRKASNIRIELRIPPCPPPSGSYLQAFPFHLLRRTRPTPPPGDCKDTGPCLLASLPAPNI